MLQQRINAHIATAFPWDQHLPSSLLEIACRSMLEPVGVTVSQYGSGRMLFRDRSSERQVIKSYPMGTHSILLETLMDGTQTKFAGLGLTFVPQSVIEATDMLTKISRAINLVLLSTSFGESVAHLVRIVHLIQSEDEQHDCSYSHPELPLSVFVSCPTEKRIDAPWRVAESIVHEAMHLQLSLIERVCPMIDEGGPAHRTYSPWKREKRDTRGILHALYVLSMIKDFWKQIHSVAIHHPCSQFAVDRCRQITDQIKCLELASFYDDLTESGQKLVRTLIKRGSEMRVGGDKTYA